MKAELFDRLEAAFPHFFEHGGYPSCGDGWFELIYETVEKVLQIDSNAQAFDIKEKYGELRISLMGYAEGTDAILDDAETKSRYICEMCGSMQGVTQTSGWIYTMCQACLDKRKYGRLSLNRFVL
jgi:hypothetical protein